jgi:hypothetical protein
MLLLGEKAKKQIFLFEMVIFVRKIAGKVDGFFKKLPLRPSPSFHPLDG